MKKLYNYPEINFIAFQEGDILAEVSLGPGAAVTGEPEIGWGDWWNSSGGSAASDSGVVQNPAK